ncbi:MAG: iron-sulfur cluster carrier protein ApbC [Pseudobdellovibrionaceae bacterium]|jgi:ATP-binding protein involved in chromosome partitioning|nr:iron-sulfur cluster carrier protein ApbC [Pseudobdellovibrionaceae bacterium]
MFSFLKSKKQTSLSRDVELREFMRQTTEFVLKDIEGMTLEDMQATKAGQAIIVVNVASNVPDDVATSAQKTLQAEIEKLTSITKATIVLTSAEFRGESRGESRNQQKSSPFAPTAPQSQSAKVPNVKDIIAVSSGKGGVGKSTVAINLALAIAKTGKKVGLLDADIYGPSIPRLAGIQTAKAEKSTEDGRLTPLEAHGLKLMSMGFLVDESAPMIWRGPMVQSALLQMVRDVVWDGLDVLVIDMPPGTGDIHLTLAQRVPLSGGVVVSTPQDIALIDARKGLEMFRKVAVPVLGIVENMSYYCCPNCGHREDIFGHGGAKEEAAKLGVPFLGEVPLHSKIRELSDAGTPVVIADPESEQALVYCTLAETVMKNIDQVQKPAPRISMED